MATDFPDPSQSPWTNPDNGITYEYDNGIWIPQSSVGGDGGGGDGGGGGGGYIDGDVPIFYKFRKANTAGSAPTPGLYNKDAFGIPDVYGRNFNLENSQGANYGIFITVDADGKILQRKNLNYSCRDGKFTLYYKNHDFYTDGSVNAYVLPYITSFLCLATNEQIEELLAASDNNPLGK